MAREAHARQDIGIEHALPVFIGDSEGVLDFKDADIIDQDIDIPRRLDDGCRPLGRGGVAGSGNQRGLGAGDGGADLRDRRFDIGGLAAVDRDRGAALGELARDGKTDSLGGAGNQRAQPGKIDLHNITSSSRSDLARRRPHRDARTAGKGDSRSKAVDGGVDGE
jgi:hypothetical protein